MHAHDPLPEIVNLAEAEQAAGMPLRTPDALRQAGYRLVKARDSDRHFLARPDDLQPLLVRLGDIAEVRFGSKQARTSSSTWSLSAPPSPNCSAQAPSSPASQPCECATAQAGKANWRPPGCAPSSSRPAS
jgi:hypothetical protein